MWLCFDLYTAGPIKMYSKTGQAVQVSNLSGEVVLSDDVGGATTFQLVGCRASDTIPDEQRPHCFSMMYINQADSYVRHHDSFLRVDPANETYDLPQFDLDSSFILLSDTFYPGLYGLKSINSPYYYITSHDDGRLGIIQRGHISNYYDTASFRVYGYNTSGECSILRVLQFFNSSVLAFGWISIQMLRYIV